MYGNLKAEMARIGITSLDIVKNKNIDIKYSTLLDKMNGRSDWKRKEMFSIKKEYFPDKKMEYLFKKEDTEEDIDQNE